MARTSTRHPEAEPGGMDAGEPGCRRRAGFYPWGCRRSPPALPQGFARARAGGTARLAVRPLSRITACFSSPEMPKTSAVTPKEPATYEQALAELDRLVQQMEGGQLPLDQLLDGYRRGAELLAYCRGRLQAVEDQVKVLEDGALKAWEPT